MSNLATAIANIFAEFGKWWNSDEQVKARKTSAKKEIVAAVQEGDKDKVNKFLSETLVVPAMVGLLLLSGCVGKVTYVPADRAVYPMVSPNGAAGWFVDNNTWAEVLKKLADK